MKLDGNIRTNCAPEQVIVLLSDREVLDRISPNGCEIGEKVGEVISFVIRRKLGPINVSLPGHLTLHKGENGYQLVLDAAHRIGGSIKATLDLTPGVNPNGKTTLSWTGELHSHGLASRLIEERATQANTIVKRLFQELHIAAERIARGAVA